MGGHGIHPVVRQPAPARREAGRPARPEGDVPDRPARLRRRLGHRRGLGQFRHAGDRAGLPGRVRRDPGAVGAVPADDHVQRSEGPRQGVRRLRRDRRGRQRRRPAARRRADRVPVVAVDALHQPGLRGRGLHRRSGAAAAASVPGQAKAGHPGRRPGVRWLVLPRLRVLERGHPQLAHAVHVRLPHHRRGAAHRIRVLAGPGRQPSAATPRGARPQPWRRVPVDAARFRGHVRGFPVPDLLPAADAGLLAGRDRLRVPADRRWHRGRGRIYPPSC